MFQEWFIPTLCSAFCLGFYDVCKKHAVKNNSVMPVLFFATMAGSLFFVFATLFSGKFGKLICCDSVFFLLIMLKSCIVAASWTCVYYAMRDLPISIAAPIRASAPLGVFLGGLILYREIPTWIQGLAMLLIFVGYFSFSVIGKMEGFAFSHSKSVHLIFLGTMIGAISALYDKYLLNVRHFDSQSVQLWFSIDLVVILGLGLLVRIYFFKKKISVFRWRWTIPTTGILLILADFCYFYAVSMPDAQISILSLVRRVSGIISFLAGSFFFRDKHLISKGLALLVILAGVIILAICK